jgi:hypothetical protein
MSSEHGGIDIEDDWIPILESLFQFCQFNHDYNGYPQLVADQIKEKFGSLRFYYHFEECDSDAAEIGKTWNRTEDMLIGACRFAEQLVEYRELQRPPLNKEMPTKKQHYAQVRNGKILVTEPYLDEHYEVDYVGEIPLYVVAFTEPGDDRIKIKPKYETIIVGWDSGE